MLLYFRIRANAPTGAGSVRFFDKVPLKYAGFDAERFAASGTRVVPGALARRGAYIAPDRRADAVPYVNIGAYVDRGAMVDTWATVGSCAQIGKNVHLSGGVGIGGVLEPLQAAPTVIEDGCFIGARSEVVEGVIVGARQRDRHGSIPESEYAHLRPRPPARSPTAGSRPDRWWCRAACRRMTAATASNAR